MSPRRWKERRAGAQADGCCCGASVRRVRARPATVALSIVLTLWLLPQSWMGPQEAAAARLGCPEQGAAREIRAEALKACLERGGRVDLRNKTVSDKLDLRSLRAIESPFACRGCRFEGGVDGSEVVFKRTVDLTGLTVGADLKMHGALFEGAALFSGPGKQARATFDAGVDFSLAVFDDILSFEDATFKGRARFSSTRFLGNASFSLATFRADASFDGAVFADEAGFASVAPSNAARAREEGGPCATADFGQGAFEGTANFDRASFRSTADFRQRCFGHSPRFRRTDFGKRVEFTQAEFLRGATFEGARMEAGATFRDADFGKAATFDQTAAGGSLDFTAASFVGDAKFFGLISDDALIFEDAIFTKHVDMGQLSAGSLLLEVEAAKRVSGDVERRHILRMIESTAKERDDLDVANDALFERRKLMSKRYGSLRRLGDIFVYRGLAGYLVRPTHPFIALAVLAFLAALVRWLLMLRSATSVMENSGAKNPRTKGVQRLRGVAALLWRHFRAFVCEYWRTIRRSVRNKQECEPEPQPLFGEVAVYRALFIVALIGLANSNPTLRQMVDAAL